jgi:uncharacterized protein YjbI with pentapeptide repeats
MNTEQQIETLLKKKVISGNINLPTGDETLMDRDFNQVLFHNFKVSGGDFCSTIFKNCTFENVIFQKTNLVGVSFNDCTFTKCKFETVSSSYSMHNCTVNDLQIRCFSE